MLEILRDTTHARQSGLSLEADDTTPASRKRWRRGDLCVHALQTCLKSARSNCVRSMTHIRFIRVKNLERLYHGPRTGSPLSGLRFGGAVLEKLPGLA
ncbi:hypothetical protein RRG08_012809 [Elysia crispata]|uniref:Uncharacterized protein n=1 Tax=Elysia crispata TaxID=231223 RepID=A0AAE0XY35_9GAST|nr:hypothetical protein RRG08_012809 [Elysia crispata]